MKRSLWIALPCVVAAMLVARPLWSEDGMGGEGGGEEMPKPGPEHKGLEKLAGNWTVAGKFWMGGPEPTASEGNAEFKVIMDGWFVQQNFSGEMFGSKFQGMGIDGYNLVTKEYTAHWCDNMGGISMFLKGTSNDGGKTIEYTGESLSGATGGMVKIRMVVTWKGDDTFTNEMFEPHEGKEARTMELTYTRKK